MNSDAYKKARERHSHIGKIMTDAEIVAEQETEIDRYREKIRSLEKALSELQEALFEDSITLGDTITVKCGDIQKRFVVKSLVITFDEKGYPTIRIEGAGE